MSNSLNLLSLFKVPILMFVMVVIVVMAGVGWLVTLKMEQSYQHSANERLLNTVKLRLDKQFEQTEVIFHQQMQYGLDNFDTCIKAWQVDETKIKNLPNGMNNKKGELARGGVFALKAECLNCYYQPLANVKSVLPKHAFQLVQQSNGMVTTLIQHISETDAEEPNLKEYFKPLEKDATSRNGWFFDKQGMPQIIFAYPVKTTQLQDAFLVLTISLENWLNFILEEFEREGWIWVAIDETKNSNRNENDAAIYGDREVVLKGEPALDVLLQQINAHQASHHKALSPHSSELHKEFYDSSLIAISEVEYQNNLYAVGQIELTNFQQQSMGKLLIFIPQFMTHSLWTWINYFYWMVAFLVMAVVFVFFRRDMHRRLAKLNQHLQLLDVENRESKDIELELLNQRKILESLMEAIPVPLFYKDYKMTYRGCNQPFLDYLGLEKHQVEGKTVYDIAPKDLADVYQQADLSLFKKGGRQNYEAQVEYADKSRHDIKFFKSVFDDPLGKKAGIIGVMLDITEMKAASKLMTKQRRYLQTIINSVAEPIRVINLDYSIALMNRAAEDALDSRYVQDMMNPKCYELYGRSTPCEGEKYPCPIPKILDSKSSTKVTQDHSYDRPNNTQENEKSCTHAQPGNEYRDNPFSFVELTATPLFDSAGNVNQIVEISRDITAFLETQQKLQHQKQALSHLANHDTLTNLPNRRLFFDRLQHSVNMAQSRNELLVLLFIDLDRFKPINDTLGHEMGDRVLKLVAKRLLESVRAHDTVARLGGDEFIVLLEAIKKRDSISMLAEKMLNHLAKPMLLDEHELFVSISIGISIFPEHGDNAHSLIKNADIAMYSAKQKGKNTYDYYSHKMMLQASERVSMESQIRKALVNEEFSIYYQPQLNIRSADIIGMEALIRWNHPEQGFIAPDRFIPIAEHSGLIIPLGEWILEKVFRQVKQWRDIGFNPGRVAINLSSIQLQQENLIDNLCGLLNQVQCEPQWIGLEITEGFIMHDPERAIGVINKFQQLGIQIAIDDFGTSYSSLAYLKRLPISGLKIDRSFIKDIPEDEDDKAICRAIIALAKNINIKVLAEGVETEQQLEFLRQADCDEVQGFYFYRPMDVNSLSQEMQERA